MPDHKCHWSDLDLGDVPNFDDDGKHFIAEFEAQCRVCGRDYVQRFWSAYDRGIFDAATDEEVHILEAYV